MPADIYTRAGLKQKQETIEDTYIDVISKESPCLLYTSPCSCLLPLPFLCPSFPLLQLDGSFPQLPVLPLDVYKRQFQHFAVYPVDDVQPFLVRHRKSGSRSHFLQIQQQVAAFFE